MDDEINKEDKEKLLEKLSKAQSDELVTFASEEWELLKKLLK